MKTIELRVWLTYDAELMYGDDPEDFNWFLNDVLYRDSGGKLWLNSEEIGDFIGEIEVLEVDMTDVNLREMLNET